MSREAWTHGKGYKSRVSDIQVYANNFDNIKFPSKEKKDMYKFRKNSVILQGDSHDTSIVYDTLNLRIPNGSDYVHLGDVGLGFGGETYAMKNAETWLDRINKLCITLNINCYLIEGNHDNPAVWELPPLSNVFLPKSGEVGIFPNGKKVLFIGGGISVDRCVRKEGIDYWKGELTPKLENVEKCDVLFSHDCPEHFNYSTASLPQNFQWYVDRDLTLMDDALAQRLNMTDIVKRSEVKEIYHGHFHHSIVEEHDGVKCRCLDINELFEYDAER